MASVAAPFKFARLVSLFLAFVFAIVGLALGASALVKGDDDKARVRSLVPAGTTVDVDTSDAVSSGGAVTGFCAALAVTSLLSLLLLLPSLFSGTAKRYPSLATRTLPLQAILLTIITLGLFGSLVAFTDIVANREAKVSAHIGSVTVPPAIVQSIEDAIGVTPVYHELSYREFLDHLNGRCNS